MKKMKSKFFKCTLLLFGFTAILSFPGCEIQTTDDGTVASNDSRAGNIC